MIWLALWITILLGLIYMFTMDRYTSFLEGAFLTFMIGVLGAGMLLFLVPHMIVPFFSATPIYEKTVTLQEVNGYYVTKNADGYVIVYGDEYNFTSVQLDDTPPAPEEGCEKAEAKVYQMQNTNKFWSVLPMYFANQYVICVPDGEIKE